MVGGNLTSSANAVAISAKPVNKTGESTISRRIMIPPGFRQAKLVLVGWIMSSRNRDGNVPAIFTFNADRLSRTKVQGVADYVSTIAIACPSATTSSSFTKIVLILPAAVEAT